MEVKSNKIDVGKCDKLQRHQIQYVQVIVRTTNDVINGRL